MALFRAFTFICTIGVLGVSGQLLYHSFPAPEHFQSQIELARVEIQKADQFRDPLPLDSPFFTMVSRLRTGLAASIDQMDLCIRLLKGEDSVTKLSEQVSTSATLNRIDKILLQQFARDLALNPNDPFTVDTIRGRLLELEQQQSQLRWMMDQELGVAAQAMQLTKTMVYPQTAEELRLYSQSVTEKAKKFLQQVFRHIYHGGLTAYQSLLSDDMLMWLVTQGEPLGGLIGGGAGSGAASAMIQSQQPQQSVPQLVMKLAGKIMLLSDNEKTNLQVANLVTKERLVMEAQRVKTIDLSIEREMQQLRQLVRMPTEQSTPAVGQQQPPTIGAIGKL